MFKIFGNKYEGFIYTNSVVRLIASTFMFHTYNDKEVWRSSLIYMQDLLQDAPIIFIIDNWIIGTY